ncbi:tail related protein [Curtobacterium phage Reje]|uniref:tail related protein n=1 Tax=Curtobacterium phage Reje TaxID=2851069 RepID=UPI0022054006|nr:tail related protein [Curtobacterium phage Reje]QXG07818.1 tail related protein [Curtobacterium phage Reje]
MSNILPVPGTPPTVPLGWFPYRLKPYNNIQPFVFRDGLTYLEVLESLRNWLYDQLVPYVDSTVAEYVEAYNGAIAALGVYAQDFQDYIEAQKAVFDGNIDEYRELVEKSTTDFIALATESMEAVKADADRADAAAERAEMFAAQVEALQDAAVAALIRTDGNSTRAALREVITKAFIGLGNVDNTRDRDKPVSTAQAAADKAVADVAAAELAEAFDNAATVDNLARAALVGRQMIGMGHSYIVGAGIQSPNKWAEQFARVFGMTYPTLNTTNDLMRAVSGSRIEEAAQRIVAESVGALYWRLGSTAIPLVEGLINTARANGNDAATKTGALHALRTMALVPNALAKISATSSRFTYSAGWNDTNVNVAMSPTAKTVPSGGSTGATVEFTMFQPVVYVMTLSRRKGLPGHQMRISNVTGGGTITTFDNTNTSAEDTPHDYVNIPIRVEANIGDVIRINKASGDGAMTFDGVIVPKQNHRPMFFMKEPYLADYSMSTSYPNGSDNALKAFNDLIDTVAKEFPTIISADPNTSGKWNKNTMLQSDGVHPNALGSAALAEIMADAVNAQLPGMIIRNAMSGD